jgi:hypothetical protein
MSWGRKPLEEMIVGLAWQCVCASLNTSRGRIFAGYGLCLWLNLNLLFVVQLWRVHHGWIAEVVVQNRRDCLVERIEEALEIAWTWAGDIG